MKAAAWALAAVACSAPCFGCASTPPTSSAAGPVEAEPRWEDVFDRTPELLAVVFPTALRKDAVYGPLLRRAIDLVREQSRVVAETRALDAMEDAEEVIVGVRPDVAAVSTTPTDGEPAGREPGEREAGGEVVVVVRGVRADVDPVTLVDADGHALWEPGPSGRVRELVRRATPTSADPATSPVPASLFELPGRTWVIASGDARARARSVFARPLGRSPLPAPTAGGATLLTLRIDGPSLVARVRALQRSSGLAAIGRRLEAVTLELAADPSAPDAATGSDAAGLHRTLKASLSYAEADAATSAEATARDVVAAIARKRPEDLAWLASASVERPAGDGSPGTSAPGGSAGRTVPGGAGRTVIVTAPLPSHLVGALLHAGAATLQTDPTP
ncbi:MAG TPA: hypothetical protein VK762_36270 [Polyangiaceae bacterium]|nr:hypothetical protein [Polyangiaceae bacterium]